MDWNDQPAQAPPPDRTIGGLRRGIVTAVLAVGLLVVGGAAAVTAASPDPSASAAPNATTQPSDDGSTTPSPSAKPDRGTGHNCPNKGTTDDSSGTSSSDS